MKPVTFLKIITAMLYLFCDKTYSQTNQWSNAAFGARLSITITNSVIYSGAEVALNCVTTNFSTNTVCFVYTDWHGMYEIDLTSDCGKTITLNNLADAPGGMETMGGVKQGESFQQIIPLFFNNGITPGRYNLIVKQKVYLLKNFDRKNMTPGELISNASIVIRKL